MFKLIVNIFMETNKDRDTHTTDTFVCSCFRYFLNVIKYIIYSTLFIPMVWL